MRKLILGLLRATHYCQLFSFRMWAAAKPAHHDGMPTGQHRKGQTVPGVRRANYWLSTEH
jgi:hypothetical protein